MNIKEAVFKYLVSKHKECYLSANGVAFKVQRMWHYCIENNAGIYYCVNPKLTSGSSREFNSQLFYSNLNEVDLNYELRVISLSDPDLLETLEFHLNILVLLCFPIKEFNGRNNI